MALTHGLRHDPMEFVRDGDTLEAAFVRKLVFSAPKPGDDELFKARIEEMLSQEGEDGTLGEQGHSRSEILMELVDLGADLTVPVIQRTIQAELNGLQEKGWIRGAKSLHRVGMGGSPQVKAAVESALQREDEWNGAWKLCPWGAAFYVRVLWQCRELADVSGAIRRALEWMTNQTNEAGSVAYKDPWGLLWAAAPVKTPEAAKLVRKLVPVILRGQEPDGGWGDGPYSAWSRSSLKVFRALVNHGLLDELRSLPPLPPDWKIVREIPAPEGDLWTMTWDGSSLWVLDRKTPQAIAVSPQDGAVLRSIRIEIEKPRGIGWWEDGLGVAQDDPKRVVKLDPGDGKILHELPVTKPEWASVHDFAFVNGRPWIADGFNGMVIKIKSDEDGGVDLMNLAGPEPISIAAAPDGVWHIDAFAPMIAKTSFDGKLLQWGEQPFKGRCDGLAFDGANLWALDAAKKRICIIEPVATQQPGTPPADERVGATPPSVMLPGIEELFARVTNGMTEHAIKVGDELYMQSYVFLTTHLVEMWLMGWEDADFDTLAAVSGASALFGYEPGEFGPKYAHTRIEPHERIARATGFGYEWYRFKDEEDAWQTLKATIDSGHAVKGWHYENVLFGGYQEADVAAGRKVFTMADGPETFARWWTWEEFSQWLKRWSFGVLGGHTQRVKTDSPQQIAQQVMTDLVEWSRRPPAPVTSGFPKATFGLDGIAAYGRDCANTDAYESWSACHDINPQWTIRNSTAVYLEGLARDGVLVGDAAQHALEAAKHYRAAFKCWRQFYKLLGHSAPEGAGQSRQRREAGAQQVKQWLEHERAAIAALQKALDSDG